MSEERDLDREQLRLQDPERELEYEYCRRRGGEMMSWIGNETETMNWICCLSDETYICKCKNTRLAKSSRMMCFQHSFLIIINVYNHIKADLFLGGEHDLEEEEELDSELLEDRALYLRFERPLSCWYCLEECSE